MIDEVVVTETDAEAVVVSDWVNVIDDDDVAVGGGDLVAESVCERD